MKHQTLDELQRVPAVHAEDVAPRILTRAERLERWADLLAADPDRRLNTLPDPEDQPGAVRPTATRRGPRGGRRRPGAEPVRSPQARHRRLAGAGGALDDA